MSILKNILNYNPKDKNFENGFEILMRMEQITGPDAQ
jgi:hypothetical protein